MVTTWAVAPKNEDGHVRATSGVSVGKPKGSLRGPERRPQGKGAVFSIDLRTGAQT